MGDTLIDIAKRLKKSTKKTQLIYAFNGVGKTRLSMEFKNLVQPKIFDSTDDTIGLTRDKILYYNAFTEDLFYWDNDLEFNSSYKMKIQPNTFINWIIIDQGQDQNIIANFQRYTDDKLNPNFYMEDDEITFSYQRGNDVNLENIKLSKGEESNFVWSIFYTLLESVINELNITEKGSRSTNEFDDLEYVFIDDPVSSLDDTHLIEVACDIGRLIKSSDATSKLKFIITTHNPLFYNVLHNELGGSKYLLEKFEDGSFELIDQATDSPFAYHLFLKEELANAIENNNIQKYHFNFLRNLYEKTSTFLGYKKWQELLPEDNQTAYEARLVNISSHSKHSATEVASLNDQEKQMLKYLFNDLESVYNIKRKEVENNE